MTPLEEPVGRLVVCPTPIGNLEDITLRVLAALRGADLVACEDTRRTAALLRRHGIEARMVSLHEHNESARAPALLRQMRAGSVVALVSDAGTPLISDPGYALVREVLAAGIALEVLPGPSAVLTALVASGLPAERWRFAGFLPRRGAELQRLLDAEETLVAFESPRRLPGTLALLAGRDPQRPVAVCRELTKLHEEVIRGSARELSARFAAGAPKGEVALVIGAAPVSARPHEEALAALGELVEAGAKPRAAATVLARLTGVRANELYGALTRARGETRGAARGRGRAEQ